MKTLLVAGSLLALLSVNTAFAGHPAESATHETAAAPSGSESVQATTDSSGTSSTENNESQSGTVAPTSEH